MPTVTPAAARAGCTAFITAMQFGPVDLLGFSIGSFAAQQIAPIRPAIVRKPTTTRTRGAAPGGDGATIGLL
jgi:pimeloyl-ACP methyl ester carboxylesterase